MIINREYLLEEILYIYMWNLNIILMISYYMEYFNGWSYVYMGENWYSIMYVIW